MLHRIANPIATLLIALLLLPGIPAPAAQASAVAAGEHVVAPAELQKAIADRSAERTEKITALRKFFSSASATRALRSARLDPARVQTAVASLDDADLARLAARAEAAKRDFAAGALTNQQITYILIALATAVVILVIVAAR